MTHPSLSRFDGRRRSGIPGPKNDSDTTASRGGRRAMASRRTSTRTPFRSHLFQPAGSITAAALAMALGSSVTAQQVKADELEEVLVTGVRQSLKTSVEVKRNTMEIVDSITAEDIGKLPDPNVAETLTRIPGVQGYRFGGEAASPVGT